VSDDVWVVILNSGKPCAVYNNELDAQDAAYKLTYSRYVPAERVEKLREVLNALVQTFPQRKMMMPIIARARGVLAETFEALSDE